MEFLFLNCNKMPICSRGCTLIRHRTSRNHFIWLYTSSITLITFYPTYVMHVSKRFCSSTINMSICPSVCSCISAPPPTHLEPRWLNDWQEMIFWTVYTVWIWAIRRSLWENSRAIVGSMKSNSAGDIICIDWLMWCKISHSSSLSWRGSFRQPLSDLHWIV